MATTRWIALLRGVNVGGARRLPMAELAALVAELGGTDVKTVLASGNVVFSAPARPDPGPALEAALARFLGGPARVAMLKAPELAALLAAPPLANVATGAARHLYALALDAAARAALAPLALREWAPERFALDARGAWCWLPAGVADSALMAEVERVTRRGVTTRNEATLRKVLAAALAAEP
ncbi:MAG: DUF1697 domain-containing protein [Gemmatimonadales bacterium]|nr:DUF1697 domain-containing protein [Gemmatimonadales bacterium]